VKTSSYNPSPLEVDLANALFLLQNEIQKHLQSNKIVKIEPNINRDNPTVKIQTIDKDGDPHEIIIRIIQVPDRF